MARTISVIQSQIQAQMATSDILAPLLGNTSKVAKWNLFTWVIAVCIAFLEQLWDILTAEIETTASTAITGNTAWLRQQVLNFQFGYIVTINPTTFSPSYTTIDTTAQIISRCAVIQTANNIVSVKVATGNPPAQLSTIQQTALQGYLNSINFAGVQFNIINQPADILYLQATIWYNGQYNAVIQANVISALNAFLANALSPTNFNGTIEVSDIIVAIKAVSGVKDVEIQNLWIRPAQVLSGGSYVNTNFGDGIRLVNNYTESSLNYYYQPASGYTVNEASPNDFATALTFNAQ